MLALSERETAGNLHLRAKMNWQQTNLRQEVVNAHVNFALLNAMRAENRAINIDEVVQAPPNSPALICSSGCTLDPVMPHLKNWKGAIFCSTSHGVTLIHAGRAPDFMCTIDPNVSVVSDEFTAPENAWKETTLISHPGMAPQYANLWFSFPDSKAILFRICDPSYDYYVYTHQWAYPWITRPIPPFIDTTSMQIALASFLGYDPIYLAGVDYGGPRFELWVYKDGKWLKDERASGSEQGQPITGPAGISTSEVLLYSARGSYVTCYKEIMHPKRKRRIYRLGKKMNIPAIPYYDPAALFRGENPPAWSKRQRHRVADAIEIHLFKHNTNIVPVEGGFGTEFRVYMAPEENMLQAITELNAEIISNRWNFEHEEKRLGQPVRNLMKSGDIIIVKGDMVLHSLADLDDWDWRRMKAVDIEKYLARMRRLKAQ